MLPFPVVLAIIAGSICLACMDGPNFGPRPAPPGVEVAPLRADGSARVVRIVVRVAPDTPLEASELWLFSGALSEYHIGRINRRDVPDTLAARQVPVLSYASVEGKGVIVAPSVALELGQHYTLAAPGFGLLTEFDVAAEDSSPLLERLWPPRGAPVAERLVLCAESVPDEPLEVPLEPSGLIAALEPDFGIAASGRPCVALRLPKEPRFAESVLSAENAGFLFDPEPIQPGLASAVTPASCAEDEFAIGPGCAWADDDRLSVRSAEEPLLWVLETRVPARIELPGKAGRLVVRDLEPNSEQHVVGRALDLAGTELPFDVIVQMRPERSHLVLNEILFNPIGAEPAGEWLEVFNDGWGPAELSGLWLRDAGSRVELPAATLAAGHYALLVRADFPAFASGDVPPAPGTELFRLPGWLKGGLSNTGEPMQLEDAAGVAISRFPALPSRHAGTSLARSRPDASDDDGSAFAEHAPPGASPGAVNALVRAAP